MRNNKYSFLLIEDDHRFREFLHKKLSEYGEVRQTYQLETAKSYLSKYSFDFAFIDMKLGENVSGIELASMAKEKGIKQIIVLTGFEDDEIALESYKAGATDFYTKKNFKRDADNFLNRIMMRWESESKLVDILKREYITNDEKIKKDIKEIMKGNINAKPIFIDGETGVGKTQFARMVYKLMGLKGEFVELNCAGLSESLLESELFGHVKGAFSGAVSESMGKLKKADGGVLLLDEIGDMPKSMQASLLKAIEEKTFYPVGSNKSVKSDFMVISATKQNLSKLLDSGSFRDDFYHRIASRKINISSLRDRKSDIPLLLSHFLKKCLRKVILTEDTKEILKKYNWYGNVRELIDFVDNISIAEGGIITPEFLPNYILENKDPKMKNIGTKKLLAGKHFRKIEALGLNEFLNEIKYEAFMYAEDKNDGVKEKMAKDLKVSRNMLYTIEKNNREEHLQ
jgi:DNA-binding NtrC family response regulator